MPGTQGEHHIAEEPRVRLGIAGDPFSLFYDYDQTRDRKLSKLGPREKVLWFRARMEMVFLQPLRHLWQESSEVFRVLMLTSPDKAPPCSFSIAAMVVMLDGVEAIGGLLAPDIPNRKLGANRERFNTFLGLYMAPWVPLADVLWRDFRNGIAHGFQISPPHSLEFLEEGPFERQGGVTYVCPLHFFRDLETAVAAYLDALCTDEPLLQKFEKGFGKIYPC